MSGFIGVRGLAVRVRNAINWPMERSASYVWPTIVAYTAAIVYTRSDSVHAYFERDSQTLRLERGQGADEASADKWEKAARNVVATLTFFLSAPFLLAYGISYGWVLFTDPALPMVLASTLGLVVLGVLPHTAVKMLTEANVQHPGQEAT